MTHVEDARLNGKGSTASWDLPALPPGGPWSSFRIFMTGTNSNHKYFLACSGLELYGRLFEAEDRPLTSFGGAEIAAAAALPPVAPVRQAGLEQAGQMQLAWSGRDFDNQVRIALHCLEEEEENIHFLTTTFVVFVFLSVAGRVCSTCSGRISDALRCGGTLETWVVSR